MCYCDPDCPAAPPCSCEGYRIFCDNLTLTNVPQFYKPSNETKLYPWAVLMQHNRITHIPSRAFEHLPIRWLNMFNNDLVSVADDAFVGVEQSLYGISLNSNNLTSLPAALGNLKILNQFNIQDNPLTHFDHNVLTKISGSLQSLTFGSPKMHRWPSEIKVLKALESLTIQSLSLEMYPDDMFNGLEHSLTTLDFESTNVQRIPEGLKTLKSLATLIFNDNIHLDNAGFTNDSFHGMYNLTDISIQNSSLVKVPDFSDLVNLQHLSLTKTNITEWDRNTIAENTILSSVELDQTEFSEIPIALQSIPNIVSISLMYTNITAINENDLTRLFKLQYIYLGVTPIKNISIKAFKDNNLMRVISLDQTYITELPRAVQNLTNIQYMSLDDDRIQCTCESLGWTAHWKHNNRSWWINGDCFNLIGTSIISFIHNDVPNCPK